VIPYFLPNPDLAVIPFEKLEGYSLNPNHEKGRHKALVFRSALGIGLEEAPLLRAKLAQVILRQAAVPLERNPYGQKYRIDFKMSMGTRQATVRSAWIVRNEEDFPRLVTCYIL
jgi:hypothetical protein